MSRRPPTSTLFPYTTLFRSSPSMCARRIFEITASGTPVVSAPSPAIGEFFSADEVPQVTSREDAAHVVRALVRSRELRDRTVHRAQRRIWHEHTYAHRARQVLEAVGLADRAGAMGLVGGSVCRPSASWPPPTAPPSWTIWWTRWRSRPVWSGSCC